MVYSFPDKRERITWPSSTKTLVLTVFVLEFRLCLLFFWRYVDVSNINSFSVVGKWTIVYFLLKNGAVWLRKLWYGDWLWYVLTKTGKMTFFLRVKNCGAYISVIYLYNSCIMWFSDVTRVCKTFVVLFDTKNDENDDWKLKFSTPDKTSRFCFFCGCQFLRLIGTDERWYTWKRAAAGDNLAEFFVNLLKIIEDLFL